MKTKIGILTAAAALVLVQRKLDGLPEKGREAALFSGKLPPTSMLPAYVASLFLGSFRAVAVIAAWLDYEKAEKERRPYRVAETLELIRILQPRNEEVQLLNAWHSTFNMSVTVPPEQRWRYEKLGLQYYHEALENFPTSPQSADQTAMDIERKCIPQNGDFNEPFFDKFRTDPDVRRWFGIDSPFEAALILYRRSREILVTLPEQVYKSPMGRYLTPYFTDCTIRDVYYYDSMYRGRHGDLAGASIRLRQAAEHCRRMIKDHGLEHVPSLVHRYLSFYPRVEASLGAIFGPSDREAMDAAMPLLREFGGLDDRYLFVVAGRAKRNLSGDPYELNDREIDSSYWNGDEIKANIWPADDIDRYRFTVPKPAGGLFRPYVESLGLENLGKLKLSVLVERVTEEKRHTVLSGVVPPERRAILQVRIEQAGSYEVVIRAAEPGPDTLDSWYLLRMGR